MNNRLDKLKRMQAILKKKANDAKEAQRKLDKEQRTLVKEINKETLMHMAHTIESTGFPIDNISFITGLALYGKELLDKQDEPEAKATIVSYMKRYDAFAKENEDKEKGDDSPIEENQPTDEEDGDDDV